MITNFKTYILNESTTLSKIDVPVTMLKYLHGNLHISPDIEYEKIDEKLSIKMVERIVGVEGDSILLINKKHRVNETLCLFLGRVGSSSYSVRYASPNSIGADILDLSWKKDKTIKEFSESITNQILKDKIKEWAKLKGSQSPLS